MPLRNWSDDNELIRDLREAMRPSTAEQQIIDAARAAYAWRTVEADLEIAALLYDSDLDRTALVRGALSASPRTLVFGRGSLRVEIEVSETSIEGQLVPPEGGVVRLVTVTGASAEATTDEVGCFAFSAQGRFPIRFECSLAGGRFATEWIMA
jgi:hypothetical protein